MKHITIIVLNGIFLSAVILAAYAFVVSQPLGVTINVISPGIIAYTSCPSTGPANPVTTLSIGTAMVGGSHSMTLFIANRSNGTITLGWNSTIRAASSALHDSLVFAANEPGTGHSNFLNTSNCAWDGRSSGEQLDVNGTMLQQGEAIQVFYTVSSSTVISPGSYSWALNIGVQ